MSKVCKHCGNILDDDARFCTQCGSNDVEVPEVGRRYVEETQDDEENLHTIIATADDFQPVNEAPKFTPVKETPKYAPANEAPQFSNTYAEPKYSAANDAPNFTPMNNVAKKVGADKKKMFILIGGGVGALVLLVAVILIISSFFGGYKSAIDNYLDVNLRGQFNKAEKLAPKEYWEWYEDEYDRDIDDVKDTYEDSWDDTNDYYEDEYGKNWKVSYTVKKEKEIDGKKLEKIAEAFEDKYDIDAKEVKKAYDLELELVISGPDDEDDEDVEWSVVQIGGSWYRFSYSKIGSDYSVSISR